MRKNLSKLIFMANLVFAMALTLSCSDNGNDNPPDDGGSISSDSSSDNSSSSGSSSSVVYTGPSSPEPMSTKTALQYFKDEGITIGINVGNSLDAVNNSIASETAWGNPKVNQAYITGLKASGFKIIRIPVSWTGHIGTAPDYEIELSYLKRVAEVVNMAKTAGLKAFINIHHDGNQDLGGWLDIDRANSDPAITQKYVKVWTQIAEYFKDYGDWLMFQGFNEIHKKNDWSFNGTAAQYTIINDWNQKFTNAVRSTGGNNANRYLLYYGYMISPTIATTDYTKFKLPTDPATGKQVVGFHYYEPIDFSLKTTSYTWENISGARNDIASYFRAFKTKFIDNGIPVIIGENGPAAYASYKGNTRYNAANVETAHQNRLLFIDYMYGKAKENGLVPIYWENGTYQSAYADEGDFSLFNRNSGQPNSTKSSEVIERMVAAMNSIPPSMPEPITIGDWEWSVINDYDNGGTSTITMVQGSGADNGKITFSGNVTTVYEYGYAAFLASPNESMLANLKKAKSISFKVKGDGKTYKLILPTSNITDYSYYFKTFTASSSETVITIKMSDLRSPGWGESSSGTTFNQNNVSGVEWQTNDGARGTFSLTVSDLTLNQ